MSLFRSLLSTLSSRLPSEYQEVEYITGVRYGYINTGFDITDGYKFELDISFNELSTQYIIGAVDFSYPITRSHLACFDNGGFQFGLGAKEDIWTGLYIQTNTRYKIEASTTSGDNYIKVNGTLYGQGTYTYSLNNYRCYLLSTNGMSSGEAFNGNMYSCKIYDNNDVLIRDFIPCYRKSDNKVGMYDIVNNVFYTSEGNDFTKGQDV